MNPNSSPVHEFHGLFFFSRHVYNVAAWTAAASRTRRGRTRPHRHRRGPAASPGLYNPSTGQSSWRRRATRVSDLAASCPEESRTSWPRLLFKETLSVPLNRSWPAFRANTWTLPCEHGLQAERSILERPRSPRFRGHRFRGRSDPSLKSRLKLSFFFLSFLSFSFQKKKKKMEAFVSSFFSLVRVENDLLSLKSSVRAFL